MPTTLTVEKRSGRVYKITNDESNDCYVGSTNQPLMTRFYRHLATACIESENKSLFYQRINELNNEKWKITLLEEIEYENTESLRKRERYWWDLLKPNLNQRCPYVSAEEYVEYQNNYAQKKLTPEQNHLDPS